MNVVVHRVALIYLRIIEAIVLWWQTRASPEGFPDDVDVTIEEPEPEIPAAPAEEAIAPQLQSRPRHHAQQPHITWHLRTTILDRLDEYFHCLRRLQHHDPDSYDLFSRVGFAIPADWYVNPNHAKNLTELPSTRHLTFGGILLGGFAKKETSEFSPSFAYFHKLKRPGQVQTVRDADVYTFTMVYDDRKPSRGFRITTTVPLTCHVALRPDGSIAVLRERCLMQSEIRSRRSPRGRREKFTLTTTQWAIPGWVAEFNAEEKRFKVTDLFVLAFLTYTQATSRIVVRVAYHQTKAAFGIDISRAKYFFHDRGIELAVDGKRKRIFHAVTEHTRRVSNDRTTTVRYHYRGVRHFEWNGYQVGIVLPKHASILQWTDPATAMEDIPEEQRSAFIGMNKAGEMLDNVLSK